MGRIRTIKPEMAKHEELFDLEISTGLPIRFAWAMLPTACDREGRFQWRPRTLKADILPHDLIEFSRVLDAWLTRGFILKYRVGNDWFGWVPTFRKHQIVNTRETASALPPIESADEVIDYRNQKVDDASATRDPRDDDASATREVHARVEGKGREEEGKKELPPTAGASPPSRDPDPIFGTGLAFLVSKGVAQKGARTFLGLMRKECGDLLTAELLAKAETDDVSDPLGWLRAAGKARAGPKGNRPAVNASFANEIYTGTPADELFDQFPAAH